MDAQNSKEIIGGDSSSNHLKAIESNNRAKS